VCVETKYVIMTIASASVKQCLQNNHTANTTAHRLTSDHTCTRLLPLAAGLNSQRLDEEQLATARSQDWWSVRADSVSSLRETHVVEVGVRWQCTGVELGQQAKGLLEDGSTLLLEGLAWRTTKLQQRAHLGPSARLPTHRDWVQTKTHRKKHKPTSIRLIASCQELYAEWRIGRRLPFGGGARLGRRGKVAVGDEAVACWCVLAQECCGTLTTKLWQQDARQDLTRHCHYNREH
jgi:hypothetical protein